jgi:thioredoxin 1
MSSSNADSGNAPGCENILLFAQPGALPESALEELIQKILALDMVDVKKQIAAQNAGATSPQ